MNEFYLPKQSTPATQYLIEKAIYEDVYQYRDCDNITLKMLQSMILNQNKFLFIQVLSKKTLQQQEIGSLLQTVCEEGDDYLDFFIMLYEKYTMTEQTLVLILQKCLVSGSVKILKLLFTHHNEQIQSYLSFDILCNCIEKNPDIGLLEFLIQYIDKSLIINNIFLEYVINNDYVKLFIFYTQQVLDNNWNSYLNQAISKNAYDIICYILSEISVYRVEQPSDSYNEFFDYLITENFDKVTVFLDKVDYINLLGKHNLEKLLLSFEDYESFEILLFHYNLMTYEFNNENLQQKIKKYLLNRRLKQKLIPKNKKTIKKI